MRWKIGKYFAVFLCAMVCCTLIARGAAGALVARADTALIRKGTLESTVSGEGRVQVGEVSYQFLPEGQKVKELLVREGTTVEEGQDILLMDEGYLQDLIDEQSRELEKLNLQLRQQEIQGQSDARTPETASAQITLDGAKDGVNQAQRAYEQAVAKAQNFAAVPPGEDASEEEILQWNQTMEELNMQIESLYEQLQSRNAEYNQAVEQYNLAQQNEENLRKNQEKEKQANQLACESIQVDIQNVQKKIKKLEGMKENGCVIKAQAGGIFLTGGADVGTVTTGSERIQIAVGTLQAMGQIAAEDVGKIQPGDEVSVTFPGMNDPVSLQITHLGSPDTSSGYGTGQGTMNGESSAQGDSSAVWYAELTETQKALGTEFSYTVKKESEAYQQTISLSALRESQGSTYILSVVERDGILGKEYTAVSVPVTVKGKDENKAAIECTLEDTVPVIVASNKYIEEGDPVRLDK